MHGNQHNNSQQMLLSTSVEISPRQQTPSKQTNTKKGPDLQTLRILHSCVFGPVGRSCGGFRVLGKSRYIVLCALPSYAVVVDSIRTSAQMPMAPALPASRFVSFRVLTCELFTLNMSVSCRAVSWATPQPLVV